MSVSPPPVKQLSKKEESVVIDILPEPSEEEVEILKTLKKRWYPRILRCTWKDLQPMAISLISVFLALIEMSVIQATVVYPNRVRDPGPLVLWDITFSYLPHVDSVWWHEVNVYGYVLFAFVVVVGARRRVTLLRRKLLLWAIAFLLRSISITLTAYPDPSDGCQGDDPLPNIWLATLKFQSCGDLVFSGHTVAVLSSFFIMFDVWPLSWNAGVIAFHTVSLLIMSTGILCILATRLHYTTDVFAAILVYLGMRLVDYLIIDHYYLRRTKCCRWWERDRYAKCGITGYEGWGHIETIPQWVIADLRTEPAFIRCKQKLEMERLNKGELSTENSRATSPSALSDVSPKLGSPVTTAVTVLGMVDYQPTPQEPSLAAAAAASDPTASDTEEDGA